MAAANLPISPNRNLANYKNIIGYSEPIECVCDAEFVEYVQTKTPNTVAQALQALLGAHVRILTTWCISKSVTSFFRELGHHRDATLLPCAHDTDKPEYQSHNCLKSFVRSYKSQKLAVCCMEETDYDFYKKAVGRILVTPDADKTGGILIASTARVLSGLPPPEIQIMDDYRRIFHFKDPFQTICEPGFFRFVQNLGRGSLLASLESLLGGSVKLHYTSCMLAEMVSLGVEPSEYEDAVFHVCRHGEEASFQCMKTFVFKSSRMQLVVCTTLRNRRKNVFAKDPGTIIVTPNNDGTDILIDTRADESLFLSSVNLLDIRSRDATPSASKTVYLQNLSIFTERKHIVTFFKDLGGVADVRFPMRDDRFPCDALVEFTTLEAAQKAIELDRRELLGRVVRIHLARKKSGSRNAYTDRSVFVTGFVGVDTFDSFRATLKGFCGQCGEVSRVAISEDFESGVPKGMAFIEFANNDAYNKALELNRTHFGGGYIIVSPANRRGEPQSQSGASRSRSVGIGEVAEVSFPMGDNGSDLLGGTVFVRGFGEDVDYDTLRAALEGHFDGCGEISRLSIPKDYASGVPKGYAFIEFADTTGFNKALKLRGTEVAGGYITVAKAKPKGESGSVERYFNISNKRKRDISALEGSSSSGNVKKIKKSDGEEPRLASSKKEKNR